jgi:YD repeat-containing protein
MLTQISNGVGMVSTFGYDASGAMAIAADRSGTPWSVLLPVSVPVPITEDVDPGAGGPHRVVRHVVRDGFWDGVERRFGGFLLGRTTHVALDPTRSKIEETRFLAGLGTDRVLRGQAWYVQTDNGDGTTVSVTRSSLSAIHVAGLPDSPLCSKGALLTAQTFLSEGVASPIEIRTTYEVDSEVRPIAEHHFGRIDLPGDEKTIRRVWASDDTTGVRDRMCQETMLEGDGVNTIGAVVSDTRRLYGDVGTAAPLPFGQVGRGFVRSVQGRLKFGADDRWIDEKTTQYSARGNPVSVVEGGVTRDLVYDLDLFPTSEAIRGNSLLAWTATWDQARDKVATIRDPNGDVVAVSYDGVARPTAFSVNGGAAHVHYAYDWRPPTPKTTTWVFDGSPTDLAAEGPTWPTGPHWRSATSVANGAGEKLYDTTPYGNQFIVGSWKERDERGQVVRLADAFYAATTSPTGPPAGTRIQIAQYDAQGRLRQQTLANGATKTIAYQALSQTTTSSDLGPTSAESDGLARIIHTQRSSGLSSDETLDTTYDAADRIVGMNLQGGAVARTFVYDTLGRLRSSHDPDTGDRQLDYNDANQLIADTNGIPQSTFYDYDPVTGRLARRGESATPNAATDFVYTYDSDPNPFGSGCHLVSRLAAVKEPAGDVHFCFDMLGHQAGIGRTISLPNLAATTASATQSYSFSGLPLTEAFDDGFTTSYQYDAAGRIDVISTDAGTLWRADGSNEIDASGRVVTEHYANGVVQTYQYDNLGLASQIEIDPPAPQTALYKVGIQRNSYGAPVAVTDLDGGRGLDHTASYAYDLGGRLTSATVGSAATPTQQYSFTYRYDTLQNMTFRTATGPTDIGALIGTYNYAERGYGKRQLTSILPGSTP